MADPSFEIKFPLYAFDQDQTHDLLWAEIPPPIAQALESAFGDRLLCRDGRVWLSLIERYAPLPNYPWANRWSQIAYEFLKQISKAIAIYDGEISGEAYGLSPYPAVTFNLPTTIPDNFTFTLAPRSEVAITWLEGAHEVFGDKVHPSYSEYCAIYVRRYLVLKSGGSPKEFSLDSRYWLLNSVEFSDESKVSQINSSSPIDFFLYKNFEATIVWIFESLAFPVPQYLQSWDVSLEATVRNTPWPVQREGVVSQQYGQVICSNPTHQPIPDWWFFASLQTANNNPWGTVENLPDEGKTIYLAYNPFLERFFFRIWHQEESGILNRPDTMNASIPLDTQISAFQSVQLEYSLFTQYPGIPTPSATFLEFNFEPSPSASPPITVQSWFNPPSLGNPANKRTSLTQYPPNQENIAFFNPLAAYIPFLNPEIRLFRSTQGALFVKTYILEAIVDGFDSGTVGYPNYFGIKRIILQSATGRTTQNLTLGANSLSWSGIGLFIDGSADVVWEQAINQVNASDGELISAPKVGERFIGWDVDIYDTTYPTVRVSREVWAAPIPGESLPDPALLKETIDNLLDNDLDPDTEGLIMADSIRVKEIHAALDAQKFSVNPANPSESRFANLGYYIERVARVLGISVNPDGSIRSIRQVKRLEDGEDLPAGWPIGQWGRNQGGDRDGQEGGDPSWDKDGMAYQVVGNTFLKNPFTGEVNKIDKGGHILVENWAQYFEMLKDDLDKCLGLQEGAANVLPDPDNPKNAIEYEGIGTLVAEIAYMLSEYGKHLNSIRVLAMGNQAMIQELIAALGVPVTVKELSAKLGEGEGKIPYAAPDTSAPTGFDQTVWILSQLGQIYATHLMPRSDVIQKAITDAQNEGQ